MFMVTVLTLGTEYVDGKRRHGSKGIGPDGKFSLHLDYLARAVQTSQANVKYLRRGCQAAGFISTVHEGTHGRPSCYQALVVRGEDSYGVTWREILTPYGAGHPLTRGKESSPLTYRTPDRPSHAPAAGVPLTPVSQLPSVRAAVDRVRDEQRSKGTGS